MRRPGGYFSATRHPWSCLLFLVPLIVVYEAGVVWLGGPQPELLRNGADTWLRWGLESFGLSQLYCAPALIVAIFMAWSLLRIGDRPDNALGVWVGMACESVACAIGLWALSKELGPVLEDFGIRLNVGVDAKTLGRVITYVGAGIYEELLFRLALFFVLGIILRLFGVPRLFTVLLVGILSALIFAAAHHLGPYGEPGDGYVFLFRTFAGLYFGLLYQLRGFGVAVGAHACYDVLVGVLMVQ
jgi:hypothetical protein